MSSSHARPAGYRNDLTLFTAIAFGMSWAAWAVAIALGEAGAATAFHALGAFGPLVGALVIRIRRRRRGEAAPARTVRFRKAALAWTPVLLVVGSATVLAGAFLAHQGGGPALGLDAGKDMIEANPGGPVSFFATMLLVGPLSEEPGWRGTAYPRLRATMNRYTVGLVLGVVWAVWHLPLFFIDGTVQNELGLATPSGALLTASAVPMAMLVCHAYERAGVLAAIATHFAVNTTMVMLGVEEPVTLAMIMGVQAIVAVGLLATVRPAAERPADGPAAPAAPVPDGARAR
ncbi:CPBP family intramembrane glutamic endopeptidase [Actinomadura algeriensis]|uniref:Membrane protease YdiL (CAAX protease family) n=1 Tax=Actinomadura algeriensis TaxID=1679523 RepID=A0ABR9JPC5_9ACTN|nr:type II CAAX endopeptidase family protein [Actinomadura algeriensis]MBE1531960.1 membrane protease YdiL (CAAX protease family) [Actinomadura algeriensis]